jgi:hypothetical protein
MFDAALGLQEDMKVVEECDRKLLIQGSGQLQLQS